MKARRGHPFGLMQVTINAKSGKKPGTLFLSIQGGAPPWARATKNVKKPVSDVEKLDLRIL